MLTKNQFDVLDCIINSEKKLSQRNIAKEIGLSVGTSRASGFPDLIFCISSTNLLLVHFGSVEVSIPQITTLFAIAFAPFIMLFFALKFFYTIACYNFLFWNIIKYGNFL